MKLAAAGNNMTSTSALEYSNALQAEGAIPSLECRKLKASWAALSRGVVEQEHILTTPSHLYCIVSISHREYTPLSRFRPMCIAYVIYESLFVLYCAQCNDCEEHGQCMFSPK